MIKSDKGLIIVKGTNYEIIKELSDILSHLLSESPEIVLGTFVAYEKETEIALEKSKPDYLGISEIIAKAHKEVNNDRH